MDRRGAAIDGEVLADLSVSEEDEALLAGRMHGALRGTTEFIGWLYRAGRPALFTACPTPQLFLN